MRSCPFLPLILITTLASLAGAEDRSYDGGGNNLANPAFGAVATKFLRKAAPTYDDRSRPVGSDLGNPRSISNALFAQREPHPNAGGLSGYVYAFGQFISHDIQETISGNTEDLSFLIPADDPMFNATRFPLTRSEFDPATGRGVDNPRQQINFATAFLDASPVYGSSEIEAAVLRGGPANPTPFLRTSNDINGDGQNLLPRDAFGPSFTAEFIAGDARVNDNVVLTSMHTVFMREHNRLVDELLIAHPDWTSDQLFERARKVVGALVQVITYQEFLPALLGERAPSLESTYDADLNPGVLNEFATVFLRLGHSMLTPDFKRVGNDGAVLPSLDLAEAFFNPAFLDTELELELLLKGLATETQEEVDLKLVDGMRFALLGAIDLQRARDHGLPGYNAMRSAFGLPPAEDFSDISSDLDVQAQLATVYDDVDAVEPFVGALAEDHLPGARVGALTAAVYADQFTRLRDGDRFWVTRDEAFSKAELADLEATRLSDVIARNTRLTTLQPEVFLVPAPLPLDCNLDGVVDSRDLACSNRAGITSQLLADLQLSPGDLNADGAVSFADFLVVSDNFGQSRDRYVSGDIDGDGEVGFADFLVVAEHFGSSMSAVPEPKCLPHLVFLAILLKRRRK